MYGSTKGFPEWAKQQGLNPAEEEQDVIEVLSCNWDTVMLFMACGLQWDHSPVNGQLTRLPLTEIKSGEWLMGLKKKGRAERFAGLKIMIAEVLRVVRIK